MAIELDVNINKIKIFNLGLIPKVIINEKNIDLVDFINWKLVETGIVVDENELYTYLLSKGLVSSEEPLIGNLEAMNTDVDFV